MNTDINPIFAAMLAAERLPLPVLEYRFCPDRKWRFDYAWPRDLVALEQEGGVWSGGRHTRGSGFIRDLAKYNKAAMLGWRVVRCMPSTLCTTETIETLAAMLRVPPPDGRSWTIPEVAEAAGVDARRAYRWTLRDNLPTHPRCRAKYRRVYAKDLADWLDHTTALTPEVRARLAAWLDEQATAMNTQEQQQ